MRTEVYRTIVLLPVVVAVSMCLLSRADAQDYDAVILSGRVMDPETKFDGVRNVGIKGGKIVEISKNGITGKETIDAAGHVVAPGFIDTHFHSLSPHGAKLGLRDGVTTGMDLELGALHVAKWYREKQDNWQMNFGTTIGQEFVRRLLLDGVDGTDMRDFARGRGEAAKDGESSWETHISTEKELNAILKHLDEGLRQGAIGIGSTVGYMPTGVTSAEMFFTQAIAAKYGRLTSVHYRFLSGKPPADNALATQEVLANAFALDAPLIICHFNNDNWRLVHTLLALARERGLNTWGEIYPYLAGSTTVGSTMLRPENWVDVLELKYEETVLDPMTGKYLTQEEYERLAKEDPAKIVVGFVRKKEWLPEWLKLPGVTIAGDGMLPTDAKGTLLSWDDPYESGAFHPRTAGAHGKALRLSRELGLPLMHTLSMLSYTSAKHLGDTGLGAMTVRGRMQEGMVADITIFDPETVADNSDYEVGKNGLPTTGIPYVLVNGTVVVRDSKVLKGVNPGQAIRFPEEPKGRYEPVKVEIWSSKYTVDTGGLRSKPGVTPKPKEQPKAEPSGNPQSSRTSVQQWLADDASGRLSDLFDSICVAQCDPDAHMPGCRCFEEAILFRRVALRAEKANRTTERD